MTAALSNGGIDAGHLGEPLITLNEQKGLIRVLARESDLRPSEQVALRYAEILTRTVNLAPSDFERVAATFNDSEIVELTMVTGFYNMVSRALNALEVDMEPAAQKDLAELGLEL